VAIYPQIVRLGAIPRYIEALLLTTALCTGHWSACAHANQHKAVTHQFACKRQSQPAGLVTARLAGAPPHRFVMKVAVRPQWHANCHWHHARASAARLEPTSVRSPAAPARPRQAGRHVLIHTDTGARPPPAAEAAVAAPAAVASVADRWLQRSTGSRSGWSDVAQHAHTAASGIIQRARSLWSVVDECWGGTQGNSSKPIAYAHLSRSCQRWRRCP
jgi:hypothetical protein